MKIAGRIKFHCVGMCKLTSCAESKIIVQNMNIYSDIYITYITTT